MKLNHDRVIMVANWQYCLAGKEIHMRVTEKLVKNPEEGVTLAYIRLTKDFEEIKEYVQHKGDTLTGYKQTRERASVRIEDILYFETVDSLVFAYTVDSVYEMKALYVYLLEYQSGKRVSHKRVLELFYEDVKSAKNGLIVITPDFDNFTTKLIAAYEYSKYLTETPILEGVANREYYGRSATSIENKSTIEYETEQGLPALIYGEQGVSSLPI